MCFLSKKLLSGCNIVFDDNNNVTTVCVRYMQGHGIHTKLDKPFQYLPGFEAALDMCGIHFICIL